MFLIDNKNEADNNIHAAQIVSFSKQMAYYFLYSVY